MRVVIVFIAVLLTLRAECQTEQELKSAWENESLSDSIRAAAANDWIFDHLSYDSTEYALEQASELITFSQQADLKWSEGNGWNVLGHSSLLAGKYQLADSAYTISGRISKALGDTLRIIVNLNNHGRLKKQQGEYILAMNMFREGKELCLLIDVPLAYLSTLGTNEAMILAEYGQLLQATELVSSVLESARAEKDTAILINALINLGVIYGNQNADSAALNVELEGLELARAFKSEFSQCQLLMNLGSVQMRLGNMGKSIELLNESLEKSQNGGFKNMEGLIRSMMGDYYLLNHELQEAEKQYNLAMTIQVNEDFEEDVASSLLGLARTYLRTTEYQAGIRYANEALRLTKELDNYTEVRDSHHLLYQLYEAIPLYDSALTHYTLYSAAKDSIVSATMRSAAEIDAEERKLNEEIRVSKIKHDLVASEKARQETNFYFAGLVILLLALASIIAVLLVRKRRIAQTKEREATLSLAQAKSEMKALRSQMNPHFIFNAMRSIQLFIHEGKPEDAKKYLEDFSRLIRSVLENSMDDEVTLAKDIETLELYLQLEGLRPNNPFTYEIEISEEVDMDFDTIPPLLLQPIVENSLEHGFIPKQGPGHLVITISKENGNLKCVVEDDGVGRASQTENEQSYSLKGKSLGLSITKQRLQVRDNRTRTNSEITTTDLTTTDGLSAGTRVEINIPQAA